MSLCTAAADSLTYAMKAQRALADSGIGCDIVKLDPSHAKRGCEYGISFDCARADEVRRALAGAGIRVKRYLKGGGEMI
ncbi:MAG: DUF3343 domain-containing protein [Clostridia bacterium]|nr:DUF3343 domain-containing protein [Clostridia bacterium]